MVEYPVSYECPLPVPYETFPVVGIADSNDPSLTRPELLDAKLDTEQVREVVWLALDRDTSPRSLPHIVDKDSLLLNGILSPAR